MPSDSQQPKPKIAEKYPRLSRSLQVGQAVAVALAATYGAVRPSGQDAANVSHQAVRSQLKDLQHLVKDLSKALAQAEVEAAQQLAFAKQSCRAETQSVRTYLSGYLQGLAAPKRLRTLQRKDTPRPLTPPAHSPVVPQPTAKSSPKSGDSDKPAKSSIQMRIQRRVRKLKPLAPLDKLMEQRSAE